MDQNHEDISNKEINENKIVLHKLYEVENDNTNYYKNAVILQLFESKELLCVTTEKKEKTPPYLIELYDLLNKNLILKKKLEDNTSYLVVLDNNDIAFFVFGGTKIEGNTLTVLKGSVQILNITNPEKKIINCECPKLEDHSLFCDLIPLKIKDKIGVGIVFDFEIYIFLKSNEGEKYENFKKIENFGTLSDYYIYKNFFVSCGYEELNYYDIDKDFELKTYDNLKTEDINIKTYFLFQNSSKKVQVSDHIFIYPFYKKNILFFDADKCKTINTLELKGNEFNVKCEFEVKQMLFLKNYLLILIQLLPNGSSKLLKYSIDDATLNINFISSLNLGNSKESSIFFKKNHLYILKCDNYQEKKMSKLQIYDIDI
jgi:hypothetical protein